VRVRPSTRMRAVLGIYRALRKPRGGALALATLEREWKKTGLRQGDLAAALEELVQRQLLLRCPQSATVAWELSALGERAVHSLRFNTGFGALRDWATLRQARRRRTPLPSQQRGRRRDDR
jgi:hypothetical protein